MKIQLRKNALTLAIAASLGMSGMAVAADTSSSIKGQIVGPQGNPAADTKIIIVHEPTGTRRVVTTNDTGTYNASGLRVGGPYTITIDSNKFRDAELRNVYLSLGEAQKIDQQLSELQMESIVVTGTPVLFNSSANDTYYGADAIKSTPSINRDIKDVVRNNPLVVIQPGSDSSMTIAGSNPRTNSITVDGIPLNDDFGLNSGGYPTQRNPFPLDALDQVTVQVAPTNAKSSGFTGGNVDAVFKSGTNEITGSVFYEKMTDSWAGTPKNNGKEVPLEFEEENYGFSIGAPLIENKLFFFGAYEKYESPQSIEWGPAGSGIGANETKITQNDLAAVRKIASEVYGVDNIGGADTQPQLEDEKYIIKLDWNINDYHRANFIYMFNEGNRTNNMTDDADDLHLSTYWYNKSEKLNNFSSTLYSDWTDDFSTQISITSKSVETGQISLDSALGLGDISISNIDVDGDGVTGDISFGSDASRHSNSLENDLTTFKFDGTYLLDEHTLEFGIKYDILDVENLYLDGSKGVITFNSLEDFAARQISRYTYSNGIGNNPDAVAAAFKRKDLALYVNDRWDFSDELAFSFGLRYERLGSDDKPAFNQDVFDRTGFDNTYNLDGADIWLPRAGFTYYMNEDVTIRGSVGRYAGGNPNVWISNSYSNDGFSRQNFSASDVTAPANILNTIPPEAIEGINNANRGSVSNFIDPNFDIPSQWTYMLNADVTLDIPGLGDGFAWTTTAIFTDKENTAEWVNAALLQEGDVVGSTADGALPFYDTRELEIMLTNADKNGRSIILSTGLSKTWDNGFKFDMSYTHQDITEGNPGGSSTGRSNYRYGHFLDHQETQIGTSSYETEHRFVLNLGYSTEFIENYKTNFNLFFERRSGSAYSHLTRWQNLTGGRFFDQDLIQPSGFGSTFGGNYLAYVPTANDANVLRYEGTTEAEVLAHYESLGLSGYAGGFVDRSAATSPWTTTMDLYVSQELPGFTKDHKGEVYFVVNNLLNLIDSSAGKVYTQDFGTRNTLNMDIDPATGKYIIGAPITSDYKFEAEDSTYRIKIGVRYNF
ncbi:TonB-dependent receptor [Pseudoalteromonas sp. OANN1]|uniref:TonB-dependent receptor n=1 Tax=Pseudoalteromonas sp. OANN1 TaxID=2954497 RepID=UPI0020980742|nr:TonB-dependent receptor [Pseudoalteromonas sp. OANN1]MCO7197927.1 TonB-dependent receptor [Pseudoalteromonas sp. OANN1]